MFARPLTQRSRLLTIALLLPLAVSCSDSDATGPVSDPLAGTWQATSFEVLGTDAIELGMSMRITFTAARTYSMVITNDAFGSCDEENSCTATGTYSSTSTHLTFDPGLEDEITFTYSIQGATLTLTGDIDGTPVSIVLQKV